MGDDREYFEQIKARRARETAEALAAAKVKAAEIGKEPFDLDRVLELYTPFDDWRHPRSREALLVDYEPYYYLYAPEVMTLQEFAELLQQVDRW